MQDVFLSGLLTFTIFILYVLITYLSQIPACIVLSVFSNLYEKHNHKTTNSTVIILIFEILLTLFFGLLNTSIILFIFSHF